MALYLGLSLQKELKLAQSFSMLRRTLYHDWRSMPKPRTESWADANPDFVLKTWH